MLKAVLNINIIPYIWKFINIVPIPKTQQLHTGPYPSSQTLEKSLLPYITANIPNRPTQHGYKTQHSTVMVLHTVNNTVAKGFNQMAPPARTITVTLDMSKAPLAATTLGIMATKATSHTHMRCIAEPWHYCKVSMSGACSKCHKSWGELFVQSLFWFGTFEVFWYSIHSGVSTD